MGFDNSQDIRAIKLKYNKVSINDIDKLVFHKHLKNNTVLELTEEIKIYDFINYLLTYFNFLYFTSFEFTKIFIFAINF